MKDKLKQIQQKALSAFQDAREIKDVDDLKVKFLGKKGELTAILKEMGKLSAEERPVIGQMANEVRQSIEKTLEGKQETSGGGRAGAQTGGGKNRRNHAR